MEKTIRVYFEDKGQDLIHLDVEVFKCGDMGIIKNICASVNSVESSILQNKAILMEDMQIGKVFKYADPSKGFMVFSAGVTIKEVEVIV